MLPLELRKDVKLARTWCPAFLKLGVKSRCPLEATGLPALFLRLLGLEDYTLYPLIRPGSFVEIDVRQNKGEGRNWQKEFYRPFILSSFGTVAPLSPRLISY
jgi:hypothetical protein